MQVPGRRQQGEPRRTMAFPRSQRYLELLDGTLPVSELDDEEIFRGQLRDKNGKFQGGQPQMVPRELHTALARELKARMQKKFEAAAEEAVMTVIEIMQNGEGEQFSQFQKGGVKRLQAAQYIIERVMGPLPKVDSVAPAETPWQAQVQSGELIMDIEPDEEDVHLITRADRPARRGRRAIRGEVVEE